MAERERELEDDFMNRMPAGASLGQWQRQGLRAHALLISSNKTVAGVLEERRMQGWVEICS